MWNGLEISNAYIPFCLASFLFFWSKFLLASCNVFFVGEHLQFLDGKLQVMAHRSQNFQTISFIHVSYYLNSIYKNNIHHCYMNIKKSNWVILKRTSTTFTYYWNRIKKGQKYYILQNHESRKLELGDGLSRNFLLKVQKLVASSPVMQLHTFEFWCKTK